MDRKILRLVIGALIGIPILCFAIVAAGGGVSFIQKPVGIAYLALWLVWIAVTMILRKQGKPSAYDKKQLAVFIVFGIIAAPVLLIAPPWEYANFSGPIPRDGALAWAGLAIFAASIVLQTAAMWQLKNFYTVRLGIQKGHQLIKSGPYRIVRHPGYFGFILALIGMGLALSSTIALAAVIFIFGFLLRRIKFEEEMLTAEFGEEYKKYMRETKRLIPFIY